ncbi:MAG: hypothetical protein FVQ79_03145 [Planctomycetes bacterium]|nr:hypothetical protein [Planctomycetota bacterium]
MMKTTATGKNVAIRQSKSAPAINKKTVIAIGLILVMVFMWGRLLFSDGSDVKNAKGNTMPLIPPAGSVQSVSKLERVELPVIAGRNDMITHDMFSKAEWASSTGQKTTVESKSIAGMDAKTQEMRIRHIASTLELGAIIDGVKGASKEAFVDGELVSGGSKLMVRRSGRAYEFTVEDIMRDRVILKWHEFTIAIKMSETKEVSGN